MTVAVIFSSRRTPAHDDEYAAMAARMDELARQQPGFVEIMSVRDPVTGEGVTVVTALHDLNLAASYCDRVVLLASGRVVALGTPSEVLTPELVKHVYDVRCEVLTHPTTGRPLLAFSS